MLLSLAKCLNNSLCLQIPIIVDTKYLHVSISFRKELIKYFAASHALSIRFFESSLCRIGT